MSPIRCAGLLALLCISLPAAVSAAPPFTFGSFNQAALARHAPLPAPQAPSPAPARFAAVLDWTTENVIDAAGSESLRLDGESARLALAYTALRGDWQLGIELPLLITGGGVLDAPVENWHDWFGLPNGGRETVPRDDYRYRYQRGAETPLDLDQGRTALGDARLSVARCAETRCARAMLQLPSGDADELLGGGLGLALWAEQAYTLGADPRLGGVLALGLSAVRADGPLEAQQRELIPFGWASLGYAFTDWLTAGAQFTLHGALYEDSELDALRQAGGQLAIGAQFRVSPHAQLWAGFQEDPLVESSPDFAMHLRWAWQ